MIMGPLILIIGLIRSVYAYEPSPLQEIKITASTTFESRGTYLYVYSVLNPAKNLDGIASIEIFLNFDPKNEVAGSTSVLSHCPAYGKSTSLKAREHRSILPVGSTSPKNWSCGYGMLAEYTAGSYGWGSFREKDRIKPNTSLSGFSLTSYSPPGIRDILVEPGIDFENLPPEYDENLAKIEELENRIKWNGKTIGPKALPKVFKSTDFIRYLISLNDESSSLGWITNSGTLRSLAAKLDQILKKIESGDTKTAKNVLNAFLAEVEAQKGKHLSSEAYALLKFNGKYLLDHL